MMTENMSYVFCSSFSEFHPLRKYTDDLEHVYTPLIKMITKFLHISVGINGFNCRMDSISTFKVIISQLTLNM
jgi:hypothetical protein